MGINFSALDFYNSTFFDTLVYAKTRYAKLKWTYLWKFASPLWRGSLNFAYYFGYHKNEIFKGAELKLKASLIIPPKPVLEFRAVTVSQNAPSQEKAYIRGEVLPSMPLAFFIPYKGGASPVSIKRFSLGIGLISANRYETKPKLFILRVRLPIKVFEFYHEAAYTYENAKFGKIGYDGGIGIAIGPIRVIKPIYPQKASESLKWHINLDI